MKRISRALIGTSAGEKRARAGVVFPALTGLAVLLMSSNVGAAAAVDPARLPAAATAPVDFARDIRPLFESACVKCHGPEKAKNGFRLDTRAHALTGGDNGVDILPGASAKSPLVHYVARLVPDLEMPPKGKSRLSPDEIERIRSPRLWSKTSPPSG